MKRIGLAGLWCLFCFALVELFSWAWFRWALEDKLRPVGAYVTRADQLGRLARRYDAELGWLRRYDTPLGERPRSRDYEKPLMSVFGDSFVHCDQVSDVETWEEALAREVNADIFNFGVSAYGTDQSLLRYRREARRIPTQIVAMGLIPENINRLVNVYRPFYYPSTGVRLSKPRFLVEQGELKLLPNRVRDRARLRLLSDPDFIHTLGEDDWWYHRRGLWRPRFPYAMMFFDADFQAAAFDRPEDPQSMPSEQLWEISETRELMFHILSSFVTEVSSNGRLPVILLMPESYNALQTAWEGPPTGARRRVLSFCEEQHYLCFDGIEAMARTFNTPKKARSIYRSHLTAKGNEELAKEIAKYLSRNDLLPD